MYSRLSRLAKRSQTLLVLAAMVGSLAVACAPSPAPSRLVGTPPIPAAPAPAPAAPGPAPVPSPAATAAAPPRAPAAPATATSGAGQVQFGGVLNRAVATDVPRLNANLVTQSSLVTDAIGPAMNALVKFDPNFNIVPDLATSWEQPQPTTYVFHLRRGVRFHNIPPVNGRELDAEDIKATLLMIKNGAAGLPPVATKKADFEPLRTIETPDPYTVKLGLDRPLANFLSYLADASNTMFPKEAYEGKYDTVKIAIGTGPFVMKEYTPGVNYRLVKNSGYFLKDYPRLDGMTLWVIPDSATRVASFRARKLDALTVNKVEFDTLKATMGSLPFIRRMGFNIHLGMNPSVKPFDNQAARQAVAMALNRKDLIDTVVGGDGDIANTPPIMPERWRLPRKELEDLYRFDVQKAKALLAQAGVTGTLRVKLIGTPRQPDAVSSMPVLKEQLKAIGFDVIPESQEFTTFIQNRNKGNYQMLVHGYPARVDPDGTMRALYVTGAGMNISDKEVDRLLDEEGRITDEKQRLPLILSLQRKLIEKAYVVWLFHGYEYDVLQSYVRDYQMPDQYAAHLLVNTWVQR